MKLPLTFLFILLYQFSFSQAALPTNCLSYTYASYGSIDFTMEQYGVTQFINLVTGSPKISYKKASTPSMKDVKYSPKNGSEFCNSSTSTTDCSLIDSELTYVVYYPSSLIPNTTTEGCLFPAIILFHGGGFSDCNKPDIGDASLGGIGGIAQEFAKRGYVAYVVEYRTGRYLAPYGIYLSAQQSLAEYRAFQDARGAIRSIIRHQRRTVDFPHDPYQIDTMKIFLGGNSAGSIIAIQSAYYNAAQVAAVFPTPAGQPTIATTLGAVDIDYYYGGLNTGINSDYRPLIKGVFNMWGQMLIPTSYYHADGTNNFQDFWVTYGNTIKPPMIAFQGFNDDVLPIGISPITFAPVGSVPVPMHGLVNYTDYNSESNCLLTGVSSYSLDGDADPSHTNGVDLMGVGSKGMYDIFHTSSFNQRIELYVDCDMAHGLNDDCYTCKAIGHEDNHHIYTKTGCQSCTYTSEFGTGLDSSSAVNRYMVQRATTFFQAVLTNQTSYLVKDVFIECENKRVTSYVSTLPHNQPVITNNTGDCSIMPSCSF